MTRPFFFALIVFATALAEAQTGRLTAESKADYTIVKNLFIRAAEKMPEESYGFKPSPDVRNFGQQVAHVADDQYNLCAPVKGEKRKEAYTFLESTLTSKADMIPALKKAFAYCDAAYDGLNDANALEAALFFKGRSNLSMLNWNVWHTWEHYGNVVVYFEDEGSGAAVEREEAALGN